MSEHCFTIPTPPARRLPEIKVTLASPRREAFPAAELREACLFGGFALAIFWVLAELAIALGMR